MTVFGSRSVPLLVLVAVFTTPIAASAASQQGQCFSSDPTVSPNSRIASCTDLLKSGTLSDKDMYLAYSYRALGYGQKGDNNHAIEDFDQAIKRNSNDAVAYSNRGNAYHSKGDNDRAIRDHSEAIRLAPDYEIAYSNRGVALFDKGEYANAIHDYDQAIRLNPRYSGAITNRCLARAAWGQGLETALADCNESLRQKPDDSSTLTARGFVYLRLGRIDDAIADCNAALKINPRDGRALFERGVAKLRKGDAAGGKADIATLRAVNPAVERKFASYGITP